MSQQAPLIVLAVADLELARRCAAGDRGAQRQVFRDQLDGVHATLYRVLGSNRDVEDLVQETFLEVFRSLERFRGEAKLSTWISRIAVRVAYAYISRSRRRADRVALESVPDVASDDPSAEEQLRLRQLTRRLYAVLDALEARQRIAFALHVLDGRPLREVATQMDATLVATKTRVWRARRTIMKDPELAALLAGAGEEP